MLSLIITRLSTQDYNGALSAAWLLIAFSATLGIVVPLVKYIGMLGENVVYRQQTSVYFGRLVTADMEYFHNSMSGYLTAATRQYLDSSV